MSDASQLLAHVERRVLLALSDVVALLLVGAAHVGEALDGLLVRAVLSGRHAGGRLGAGNRGVGAGLRVLTSAGEEEDGDPRRTHHG